MHPMLTQAACMHVLVQWLCAVNVGMHVCEPAAFVTTKLQLAVRQPGLEKLWDEACVGVGQDALGLMSC